MTKKKTPPLRLSAQEAQLIEQLREHPDLMERFQTILQISSNAQEWIKSADEVEGLLIDEMRRLGKHHDGKLGCASRGATAQAVQRGAFVGSAS